MKAMPLRRGHGLFNYAGTKMLFKPGDLLVVPAGVEYRFEDFTEDFATWVLFYGPIDAEALMATM
ncbi:hypothetical protein WBJ53_21855 [Spirosoma sp. SC4-14]|uniref:hypothetical protein n=1 Tax=Spirosoma sp. SC4-14 TaxID=3128900 RepID=UPI0030D2A757